MLSMDKRIAFTKILGKTCKCNESLVLSFVVAAAIYFTGQIIIILWVFIIVIHTIESTLIIIFLFIII